MTMTNKELAMKIITDVESCSPCVDDTVLHRIYVIGFLAGHLASILRTDPILRREFNEKIAAKKVKGPAAKR